MLERFALSKLALKMYGRPSSAQDLLIVRPMRKFVAWSSRTHGPAMTTSGCPGPMTTEPIVQVSTMSEGRVSPLGRGGVMPLQSEQKPHDSDPP